MNAIESSSFAVTEFLSKPLKLHIGGEQVNASKGKKFDNLDPGTGRVIATLAAAESYPLGAAQPDGEGLPPLV